MTTGPTRQALVSAGANLGDRLATLRSAMERLRTTPGIIHVESSPVYETAPVGIVDQPMFLNLVLGLTTTLGPEALLERLLAIEGDLGRVRTLRWGPRTLDLDLLAFEGEQRNTPALVLPHPRMLERLFVVAPLRDLFALPRFAGGAWAALRAQLGTVEPAGQVQRYADPLA